MNKIYLTDKIQDKYKDWKRRDEIFIKAPTGCGKSYFILFKLLPHAINNDCKILYLVNRTILKDQIEKDIAKNISLDLKNWNDERKIGFYIKVVTYQSIEKEMQIGAFDNIKKEYGQYDYIVYDECHYFLIDSTFNTNTYLSFEALRSIGESKIQIFMSATIGKIESIIKTHSPSYLEGFRGRGSDGLKLYSQTYSYEMPICYDYVILNAFQDEDDLLRIMNEKIKEEKGKWVIFLNDIKKGYKLKEDLEKIEGLKEEVVFIDAEFKKNEEMMENVENIVKEKAFKKRVLISTAVLDNGVSLEDFDLKNVVIFADSEEMFIQMLGRKRSDGNNVNLYLPKQSKAYFSQRKARMEVINQFYEKYNKEFKFRVSRSESEKLLEDILHNQVSYNCARVLCYPEQGSLKFNEFSHLRCNALQKFYYEMKEKMTED